MSIDKYGVEDVAEGQRKALEAAKQRLAKLDTSEEKTAAAASERAQVASEVEELEESLRGQ